MNSTPESRTRAHRDSGEPVVVIGAGPAGLACAIALARGGRSVVVREWHRQVGTRFHGDFQGLENWGDERDVLDELRAAGINIAFEHHAVLEGTAFDAHHNRYNIRGERPLYYLVRRGRDRGTLDTALLDQAIAVGVEVRRVDRVEAIAGPAVLATGPRRADAIAVGYLFDTEMPDGDWVAFDDNLAPLGYAYVLVHGGRGTIASCMFTGFKRQAEHVERTVAFFRQHAGLDMRNPHPFGGFANFRLPRTAIQGGHPVIGEQAGFQDALAGFGMRYAIRSGLLAARSILDGSDYATLWRSELLPLLRTGIVNRFLYNNVGAWGRKFVLARLDRGDARLALRRLYQPSILTRILFPIARYRYGAPLHDTSCDHMNCHCVWCQCQSELNETHAGKIEQSG
jgi:flavin-dependent dehydrogenase